MPVIEDLNFYKVVKKNKVFENKYFLMITLKDLREKVVEALRKGVRDCIVPFLSKDGFESYVKTLLKI